ncbi:MAG: MFS transporter [Candidatus Levybacteria bacterium]|nr:MFS transporter [Candidatus Levybacteria bacterium]
MEILKRSVISNDILRVLRIKPFLLMMASEFFSQFAFNMQNFVLIFVIYGATGSNTAVSGLILSFTIPAVLFSIFSGVFVDRWDKKKIIFFTHLFRGFLILLFLIPNLHIGYMYILVFLIAIATQFFIPAETAIIPQLIPKKLIIPGNAVFVFGLYSTVLLGYILSGPILILIGKNNTIIFLSLFFFISTIFVAAIKFSTRNKSYVREQYVSKSISIAYETREIFSFIRRARKVMHALLMLTIAQAVMFTFAVLGPGYVTTILSSPLESLSWILIAPAGVGMGIGVILLGSIGKKYKQTRLSAIGFLMVGIAFILLPFGSQFASREFVYVLNSYLPSILHITILHIIIALAFIIGFSISLVFIPSNATIQIETGQEMRGRIYGFLNALVGAVSFIPVILSGGLADILGVGTVILGVGILMVILSIVFFFSK